MENNVIFRRIALGLVVSFVTVALIFVYVCANNYSLRADKKLDLCLYKDARNLKKDILAKTPLGMSADAVLEFIKKDLVHLEKPADLKLKDKGLERYESKTSSEYTVGAYSITVLVGDYYGARTYFLLKQNVFVAWAFDKDRRLIEVFVDKLVSK